MVDDYLRHLKERIEGPLYERSRTSSHGSGLAALLGL